MPSHRILLLLRRAGDIRLAELRTQVAALRRCAGVTDVIIGVRDARGIRLLSPWLFLPADVMPDRMNGSLLDSDPPGWSSGAGDDGLAAKIIHAILANPLSIRDVKSLAGSFSRAVLADASQWTAAEREALANDLPIQDMPDPRAAGPGLFKVGGRIREPGVGGPLRILALNVVEPEAQTLLGRFIFDLGRERRLVELLDYREPTASAPLFRDGLHVRQLDPEQTDQSAELWHLVIMGGQLPFRARQFTALTARLFLFSRPTALFREHRPVAVSLDASRLTFELSEQAGSSFHALSATANGWSLSTLSNAQIFADDGSAPKPPLAAWLTLAKALEDGRSPLSALAPTDRFRERFGAPATSHDLMAARLLAHRNYEPLQDVWVALSFANELGQLLATQEQGPFRAAVFMRFLRRPPETDADPDARLSLRKRIDIVRGIVRSQEYNRIAPAAVAMPTRRAVELLHQAIFSGRSLAAAPAPDAAAPGAAEAAIAAACHALVAAHQIDRIEHAQG
jgi:hypothetical protein